MTNEPTLAEIMDALESSSTIDEALAKMRRIEPEPETKPDFEGFTAADLEAYFNEENLLEDGWGELTYQLKDGTRYDYNKGDSVPVKPFPHGKVLIEDDEETGGEGSQESIYIVFSVESYDAHPFDDSPAKRYFHKSGYYASYDGSNWDGDFTEVFPKQKTITVWVTKKFA